MHMFEMLKMINMNLITFQDNTNVLGIWGLEKEKQSILKSFHKELFCLKTSDEIQL